MKKLMPKPTGRVLKFLVTFFQEQLPASVQKKGAIKTFSKFTGKSFRSTLFVKHLQTALPVFFTIYCNFTEN